MLFVYLYVVLGFLYAVYLLLYSPDPWYWFPLNVLFGPIMALYIIYKTAKGHRIHFWD